MNSSLLFSRFIRPLRLPLGALLCWLCANASWPALAQQPQASPAPSQDASNNRAILDQNATFFMGRLKYSANNGNDCSGVGVELVNLLSRSSTFRAQKEKTLSLSDPELFDTPFLFMNGHHAFTLTPEEVETLKTYFSHGGFLLISGCCTNPEFPAAARTQFARIFPGQSLKPLPYDHLIYRAFYPVDRIPCLHETRDIHLEGLFYEGRLVAVLCEDGLCCSFSMSNRCNEGKGVPPTHGRKLAVNIAIYAMTH